MSIKLFSPDKEGLSSEKLCILHENSKQNFDKETIASSATLIAKNNRVVYYEHFGFSDVENNISIKPNAMFRLASMSKPITCVAIMTLLEMQKISLDDKISKYFPKFANMWVGKIENGKVVKYKKQDREITIKDLLTHSSGLGSGPCSDREWRKIFPVDGDTLSTMVEKYSESTLDFDPGTKTIYSAVMAFDVLSNLIELVENMEYSEFLKKYIFNPLEISDIVFDLTEEQRKRLVEIYAFQDGKRVKKDLLGRNFEALPNSYKSGSGGLCGSIEDYYKFAYMLLNNGKGENKSRILRPQTVKLMSTPQLEPTLPGIEYGQNWGLSMRVVTEDDGCAKPLQKGTFGWSGTYGTHFWIDPDKKICAIYMTNMTTTIGVVPITLRQVENAVENAVING